RIALAVEFALWFGIARVLHERGLLSGAGAVLAVVLLPLLARALVLAWGVIDARSHGVPLAPGQRLDLRGWLRYLAGEYLHLISHGLVQLPFPGFFRSRADRALAAGRPVTGGPVVLLQHGYSHNGAVWWGSVRALEAAGHRVFTIDQPFWEDIERMAERLHARIEAILAATGEAQLTLVAHSMGGLIGRAYLRRYGPSRLHALVTIGSPHHGTRLARLALGPNGAQMRIGNPWLAELNATPLPPELPVISIWSVHDTIIVPQDASRLDGAMNIVMHGVGHVAQPADRETRARWIACLPAPKVDRRGRVRTDR
ncbi:MAG: lipase family alpha/beta hydrolase, partial [Casimicrobiaceae bacterium]